MPDTVITIEDLLSRYANDIAFVAEATPAADLDAFIDQLDTAAVCLRDAWINGHEDLETATVCLREACNSANESDRNVFTSRADKLLSPIVPDMTQEYRDMVED